MLDLSVKQLAYLQDLLEDTEAETGSEQEMMDVILEKIRADIDDLTLPE